MSPWPAAALLWLLVQLAAAVPTQPLSAADQLSQLLGPVVESAVARALSDWRPALLTDLGRLQARLEALESRLDRDGAGAAVRACARSCLQLRDQGGHPQDGVYWFTGMPVPVLCDFSHDGGGWTLLLTATTRDGWDVLSVLGRSERSPSLTHNYAILQHANTIRDLGNGTRFGYRIEAQAQTGRRRWGGVWFAPRSYSFLHETPGQTEVSIVRKFDKWAYKDSGIEKRMPWLNTGGTDHAVLTTSKNPWSGWWGTLVTVKTNSEFQHSPWIHPEAVQSGTVLYWLREEAF
ncbi:hypothetical protein FJT64_023658 [Amphibalanus amphitrite]|uniref:Fibrinogen C-terminal domain-containing protein n=1 Tax=Amphibalanus amphitrite TaxID=1232801 RepID=A0A6A4WER9_AMPAM|nr:hypothetical protein FJT64_023658 [Amphibalanus amphitrite]